MFSSTSRYASTGTVTVHTRHGDVTATKLPVRPKPPVRGLHTRTDGQRLDHIASHYLGYASAFWRLCDASGAIAPDALAARARVAVPESESTR
jgi:hypothetical protein